VVDRVVVGARYGLRDWLAQRVTAAIMAVYTVIVLAVLMGGMPINYAVWKDLFAQGWMRVATLVFAASFAWHAWVGMRDILMDYVKPAGVRLALEVAVLLVIAGYLGWTVQILWRCACLSPYAGSTRSWWARADPACAPHWSWRAPTSRWRC